MSLVETDDGAHDSSCEGHKTSTLGGFFTIRSEGSWKSKLPLASISHFAFHPEKPAQPLVGMVVALPTEPGEVAQPGSRLGAVGSGLYL